MLLDLQTLGVSVLGSCTGEQVHLGRGLGIFFILE